MVCIITINYNNAKGLEKTIKSVLSQTYNEIEYIIIDGESIDGSKAVIEKYNNKITQCISEKDNGIYHAMNKGIALATRKYLLFLNSGDILHTITVIEDILPKLRTGKDLYYGDLKWIVKDNDFVHKYPKELTFSYVYKNSLPHPATFIKRNLFFNISLYNEELILVSDWEFFMRAIFKYDVSYQHLDMVISDFDGYGLSNSKDYKRIMEAERALVMKSFFPGLVEDMATIEAYHSILKNKKFKILKSLETNKLAKKINFIWLKGLNFIIGNKK